jgi:DNA repair ATPase RecN
MNSEELLQLINILVELAKEKRGIKGDLQDLKEVQRKLTEKQKKLIEEQKKLSEEQKKLTEEQKLINQKLEKLEKDSQISRKFEISLLELLNNLENIKK